MKNNKGLFESTDTYWNDSSKVDCNGLKQFRAVSAIISNIILTAYLSQVLIFSKTYFKGHENW